MTFTFTSEAATTTQPTQGATMNVEMIEPTTPATPTQPTQGITMDNFQAPNLVGIIMQALESHITALVDKRFNERMADVPAPDFDEMLMLKDSLTEAIDEKMSEIKDEINDMIDEKISDHTSEYDHDEYDQTVRTVDDAELDDIEAKIKDVMRGMTITLDV
jgi:chemotaxis protein CheY-P-specific phosphatase CheC